MEPGRYLKNIRIKNFFSDEDFEWLTDLKFGDFTENNLNPDKIVHKNLDDGNKSHYLMSIYHNFPSWAEEKDLKQLEGQDCYNLYKRSYEIIRNTLDRHFPFVKLYTINLHILEACRPYTLHHDFNQYHHPIAKNKAWTIIIPLETTDSHTIVFKQQPSKEESKNAFAWLANENPPMLNKITDDEFNKYFTHLSKDHCKYLEIDDIYKWEKNTAFAASRFNFHCSDNFLQNGFSTKKALVMWTSF